MVAPGIRYCLTQIYCSAALLTYPSRQCKSGVGRTKKYCDKPHVPGSILKYVSYRPTNRTFVERKSTSGLYRGTFLVWRPFNTYSSASATCHGLLMPRICAYRSLSLIPSYENLSSLFGEETSRYIHSGEALTLQMYMIL